MTKKIRILSEVTLDEVTYRPNQVIELDAITAKPFIAAGAADDDDAAVAYALALPGNALIQHAASQSTGAEGQKEA